MRSRSPWRGSKRSAVFSQGGGCPSFASLLGRPTGFEPGDGKDFLAFGWRGGFTAAVKWQKYERLQPLRSFDGAAILDTVATSSPLPHSRSKTFFNPTEWPVRLLISFFTTARVENICCTSLWRCRTIFTYWSLRKNR